MQILGNRVLVSRIEEEKKDGFQTVDVQDSFIYKGRVEQVGAALGMNGVTWSGTSMDLPEIKPGIEVIFAKYSPDTQEVEIDGSKMKIVRLEDILAIL